MVKIIVRHGGLGDELCLTPIYRKLKADDPSTSIFAVGQVAPDILLHNPHVDGCGREVEDIVGGMDDPEVINIKWHHEIGGGYHEHLVDFYARQAGVELDDRSIELYLSEEDTASVSWMDELPKPIICYNSDGGWRSREYPVQKVANLLLDHGTVLQVGAGKPYCGIGYNMVGMNKSIRELGAMLSKSDLYIGNDSGIYHVAAAVGCRTVGIFTSVDGEYRIHDSTNETIVMNTAGCHGCFSKDTEDVVINNGCPIGTFECLNIDHHLIYDVVVGVLDERGF